MGNLNNNTPHQSKLEIQISPAEQVLIRLGALLHDISHIPLSHDLEKKTHKVVFSNAHNGDEGLRTRSYYGFYDKHDDYDRNPHLYLILCNEDKSVLARLLTSYSKEFHKYLSSDSNLAVHPHLQDFISLLPQAKHAGWDPDLRLLPELLFHLLTYEKSEDAHTAERKLATAFESGKPHFSKWGLGPETLRKRMHDSWYQPFRHDIIGNTLSADLLDYLQRDAQRLGIDRHADQYLLNYYVLVRYDRNGVDPIAATESAYPRYRCAIDLHDHKRGTPRVGLVNEIFRLLDLRHEIHEKAVMHRVVQAANAMLSRALLLLDDKPTLSDLVKVGDRTHSLHGDESFFQELLQCCENNHNKATSDQRNNDARRIIRKLIDRCVYRPLLIIPGDRAANHFIRSNHESRSSEYCLRSLATIIDSRYYSSFLLFVCACVEKFLQGVFANEKELCTFAQTHIELSENHDYIKKAMEVTPSRVVLWTSPYKQLYKDPALVVALDGFVDRIDNLLNNRPFSERTAPVVDRVRTGIKDADSKYADLWKLYVFISDGLFYTGTVTRLMEHAAGGILSSEEIVNRHITRLKTAQGLIIAALDCLWEDWPQLWDRFNPEKDRKNTQRLEEILAAEMDIDNFKDFIGLWVALYRKKYQRVDEPAIELSTVDINHYVHGDPLMGVVGSNCRDIRYKTDKPALAKWVQARTNNGGPDGKLVRFLEGLGVTDPKVISELEFEQLSESYESGYDKPDSLLKLLGHDVDTPGVDVVKLCLGGFPWPIDKLDQQPQELTSHSEYTSIPKRAAQTRRELEKWLLEEARILQPNVRKQLTTDLGPIINFIEAAPAQLRSDILDDLHSRFQNESLLEVNIIKSEEIINSLTKKFNLT